MRHWLLLIPIVLLGGCITLQPLTHIPPELQYVAPTGQENSLATLIGSHEKATPIDDFTTYV